jgi:hypothetical protein
VNFGSTPFACALATHSRGIGRRTTAPPGASSCSSKTRQLNRGSYIVKLDEISAPNEIDRNIMGVTIAVDGAEMPREGS